ncbi:MAG: DUF3108 domain-containing protein [Candidatus Poribacteria bacterium]|nr:DUF3108 domain-containing protein [Candidatus Poribacteria bacterium]
MHYVKHLIFICFLFGCVTVNGMSTSLVESPDISPQPLRIGEKLTYDISWRRLPAGRRTDRIAKTETLNGVSVYHIRSEMKTRALFRFYSFQNQQETFLNPSTLAPVRFRNHVQDRKFLATVAIDFREGEAEYKRISQRDRKSDQKQEVKTLTIPLGTQDELSTLYFLRSKQLTLGETYFFPVVVKGEVQKVTLTVERREVIKNKALGRVQTLVLGTSKGDRFWLTDDKRRLPVKMEAKSKMGAFKAALADIEFAN